MDHVFFNSVVRHLTPDRTSLFLSMRGYLPSDRTRGRSRLFINHETADSFFVPQDIEKDDYGPSLLGLLTLFTNDHFDLQDVCHTILSGPTAVLRWRRTGHDADLGSISLHEGTEVTSATKDGIMYTGAGLITGHRKYTNVPESARILAAGCRMGHTQPGSFIVRVYCPLSKQDSAGDSLVAGNEFPSRVVNSFLDILDFFSRAPSADEAIAPPPALNSNLADAISRLRPQADFTRQSLGVYFAASDGNVDAQNEKRQVDISPLAYEFAKSECERLRAGDDFEDIAAYGYVAVLHKDTPFVETERRREVQIQIKYGGSSRHLWLSVNRAEHALAVNFYENDIKCFIRATVDKRVPGRWRVYALQEFSEANADQLKLF